MLNFKSYFKSKYSYIFLLCVSKTINLYSYIDFGRLYRTGDFGILHKGVILYAGRTDSQVKIRGHRVDLQEVERAVSAVQGVDKGKFILKLNGNYR